LSVAGFCREHGLNAGNFHAWRLRFAKLSGQSPACATGGQLAGDAPQRNRAFVQLPLPQVAAAVSCGPSWIEVSLADGMVVRVPASNLAALDAVLSSLNRAREVSGHA
jgi:hypothetical protein